MENNLIRIGGLWINKSKDGNQYLSGNLGATVKVLIFKNKNKRPDSNDPDYTAFLAPIEPKEKGVNTSREPEDF